MMPYPGIFFIKKDPSKIIKSKDSRFTFCYVCGKIEELEPQLGVLVKAGITSVAGGPVSPEIAVTAHAASLEEFIIACIYGSA